MYRHLQARLRNNAESVAFYGGIDKEGRIINSRFKELLRHHGRILTKQWQFGMVQVNLLQAHCIKSPSPPNRAAFVLNVCSQIKFMCLKVTVAAKPAR